MQENHTFIKKSDIARSFSAAAASYDKASILQQEVGKRLLERLELLKSAPKRILDIGSGTGFLTCQLQAKFPHSQIIGVDLAPGMVNYAKSKQSWKIWKKQPFYLCADAEHLPFKAQSIDLIFSNLSLQWCSSLPAVFKEMKRLLKPTGLLFFSTFGPQTLYELRKSWHTVDNFTHVNEFTDMHDIGDHLLRTPFVDPVMDMEILTLTYSKIQTLFQDLKNTGAHNLNVNRRKGFLSKNAFLHLLQNYEKFKYDNVYPATFEIIYGHAWQAQLETYPQKEGVVHIPADRIPLLSNNF